METVSHKERAKEKALSRTLWLTLLFFVTATVLLWSGKIQAENWSNVVNWILTTYGAKSVGEKFADR